MTTAQPPCQSVYSTPACTNCRAENAASFNKLDLNSTLPSALAHADFDICFNNYFFAPPAAATCSSPLSIAPRKIKNAGKGNAFVQPSASCSFVSTFANSISPSRMRSCKET
jgi:hypothetical protein